MSAPRGARQHRPLAEQYEQWMAHLRRHPVSRRAFTETPVGAAAGDFVLGSGSGRGPAAAAAVASAGTVAGGFLVNGRHLSYGDDPRTQMWVGGQLFNVHTVQRDAAEVAARCGWTTAGPRLRHDGGGGDPRADLPRSGVGRQAGRAARVADAQRRPVLRARAPDRPGARHRVPLPLPVRGRPGRTAPRPTRRS